MRRMLSMMVLALAFAGCQGDKPESDERARPAGEREAVSGRQLVMDHDGKEYFITDRGLISDVQRALTAKGFDVVSDGRIGKETLRELTKFQLKNEIHPSGELDKETIRKLGLDYDRFASRLVEKK